jgi:hypothetical protein
VIVRGNVTHLPPRAVRVDLPFAVVLLSLNINLFGSASDAVLGITWLQCWRIGPLYGACLEPGAFLLDILYVSFHWGLIPFIS